MRLFVALSLLGILAMVLFAYRRHAESPAKGEADDPRGRRPTAPPRYTLRDRPRDPTPGANYEFDILEGERVVARYWFDFRGDDHGVVFPDGRDVWLQVRGCDFVTGGPAEFLFTPSAMAWLEIELGRMKQP